MAFTSNQQLEVLQRLTALEQHVNDLTVAINRMVSSADVQQVFTVLQTQIDDLTTTVTALEARVTAIEEEPRL